MENIEQLKTELSPSNAKVTVRLRSKNGYVYEMNFEDDKAIGLLKKLVVFELACLDEGFTPYVATTVPTPVSKPAVTASNQQTTCQHAVTTNKRSTGGKNIANKDRIYEACLDCNKFLKWLDGGK